MRGCAAQQCFATSLGRLARWPTFPIGLKNACPLADCMLAKLWLGGRVGPVCVVYSSQSMLFVEVVSAILQTAHHHQQWKTSNKYFIDLRGRLPNASSNIEMVAPFLVSELPFPRGVVPARRVAEFLRAHGTPQGEIIANSSANGTGWGNAGRAPEASPRRPRLVVTPCHALLAEAHVGQSTGRYRFQPLRYCRGRDD